MAKTPKREERAGIPHELLLFDRITDKDLFQSTKEVHYRFAYYKRTKTALFLKYELVKTEQPLICSK